MNANHRSIILAISLLFALSTSISAAPGDLDPTFGSGGIVITSGSDPNHLNTVWAMAIQADGKIVVVGDGTLGSFAWDFAVVRYNPDGSLDSSFGGTGITTQLTAGYEGASSVAIQADGKIVVAGNRYVVRYNPNGSLDTSFNGSGIVITPGVGALAMAIQADGKIVVAGSGVSGSTSDFALVRYNADGSLDTTLNGTGKVITPGGSANSVAIQSDGKIIAAGSNYDGSNSAFTLVRYNADGTLDTSFNGTGKVITSVSNSGGDARDLAIQTDGKIVVAGYSLAAPGSERTADFAVVRYNPDGSLDTSFGGTGKILIPVSDSHDSATSVAIQPNGKIVVAGSSGSNIGSDFAVIRLNPNGSLDTSFNGTGKVITSVGDSYDHASSVAIQADGKIVVAGDTGSDVNAEFVVVRYQGDGATPTPTCPNPIDCAHFFVRQHYLDFLNREPDDAGLAFWTFWTNEITSCGGDVQCVEGKRINVSAAFFLSIEFQQTGYLVYRMYKAAYGDMPGAPVPLTRQEFLPDTQHIGQGVVVGASGWEQALENNKNTFASDFVARTRFTTAFPQGMTSEQFVDALNANAGGVLSQDERDQRVSELASRAKSRAQVLRSVAEDSDLTRNEFNKAFVLMQYFGYLRRNSNDLPDLNFVGYDFWLIKLNQFNGHFVAAEMVKAFISSAEYKQRFALE
ncbi:MAG: hypothetical protein ABR568_19015 [Pyrinomonadaceae bacterium]